MNNHNSIFLVGGPGSGKDFILRTSLSESGAIEIPLTKIITAIESNQNIPEIDGRPLIVNGNADDGKSVLLAKAVLETMDYQTACIYVYTNPHVSKLRSKIEESKRYTKYMQASENMYKFKESFDGFFLFDNSSDFMNCSEDTQTQMVLWIKELTNEIESFFESKSFYHDEKLGFKIPKISKPVGGEPKGGHPVPAGYERVKVGSFYHIRKKAPTPLANQDDTQTDGTGLKEDIDVLFEKEYPTVIDMMAQKKNRKGESQGDKYKGGIAVPGDKATQRISESNQEVVVTQTQAKGVKYSKNRPAKGARPPNSYFDSRIGAVPSGGIGLTAYKTEETEPKKSVRELRKK